MHYFYRALTSIFKYRRRYRLSITPRFILMLSSPIAWRRLTDTRVTLPSLSEHLLCVIVSDAHFFNDTAKMRGDDARVSRCGAMVCLLRGHELRGYTSLIYWRRRRWFSTLARMLFENNGDKACRDC